MPVTTGTVEDHKVTLRLCLRERMHASVMLWPYTAGRPAATLVQRVAARGGSRVLHRERGCARIARRDE